MILKWAIEDLKTNKKKEITADLIKKVANNYRNFFGKKITDNDVSDVIKTFLENSKKVFF